MKRKARKPLTVVISEDLHEALRKEAFFTCRYKWEIIEQALQKYLAHHFEPDQKK